MAVTKIWAVTDSVSRVLSYAANPDKTIYSDICKALHYHKYATICSVNSKKATRLYRLGEAYDRDAIYDRMRDTLKNNSQEAYRLYYEFTEKKSFNVTIQKAHFVKGNLKTANHSFSGDPLSLPHSA